jgi:hypothetical protein
MLAVVIALVALMGMPATPDALIALAVPVAVVAVAFSENHSIIEIIRPNRRVLRVDRTVRAFRGECRTPRDRAG